MRDQSPADSSRPASIPPIMMKSPPAPKALAASPGHVIPPSAMTKPPSPTQHSLTSPQPHKTDTMCGIGAFHHSRQLGVTDTRLLAATPPTAQTSLISTAGTSPSSAHRARANANFDSISTIEDQLLGHPCSHYIPREDHLTHTVE